MPRMAPPQRYDRVSAHSRPAPLTDGYLRWISGTLEQEEFCESRGSRTFAHNEITASAEYHARDVKSVAGLNDGDVVAFVVEVSP